MEENNELEVEIEGVEEETVETRSKRGRKANSVLRYFTSEEKEIIQRRAEGILRGEGESRDQDMETAIKRVVNGVRQLHFNTVERQQRLFVSPTKRKWFGYLINPKRLMAIAGMAVEDTADFDNTPAFLVYDPEDDKQD